MWFVQRRKQSTNIECTRGWRTIAEVGCGHGLCLYRPWTKNDFYILKEYKKKEKNKKQKRGKEDEDDVEKKHKEERKEEKREKGKGGGGRGRGEGGKGGEEEPQQQQWPTTKVALKTKYLLPFYGKSLKTHVMQ